MRPLQTDTRAVSGVVGTAVLLAIALLAVSATMMAATPVIDYQSDQARFNVMQDSITRFDGAIHGAATADSPTRAHKFRYAGEGTKRVLTLVESEPRLTVAVDGTTVYDESVGSAYYQPTQSDRSISYELGGIFRAYSESSIGVEQEPALTFTDRPGETPTATIPIYDLEGKSVLYENVLVTRADHTNHYPQTYAQHNVSVTIYSEYASAWANYFNRTAPTSATVTYAAPPGETPRTTIKLAHANGVYVHLHEYDIEVRS